MKRLISAAVLMMMLALPSFALSDSEYKRLKNSNSDFANADRNLTRVWNRLKDDLPGKVFRHLREEQRDWISHGRDREAKRYMNDGYSRAEAYTMATNDRAEYLPERAREIGRRLHIR